MRKDGGWFENCENVEFLYYAKSVFSAVTGASKLHCMGKHEHTKLELQQCGSHDEKSVNNYVPSVKNSVMKNMGRLSVRV